MELAFFSPDGPDSTALVPTPMARSMWSEDQMHGVAVSGALARAAERRVGEQGRDDLRPARYTVDLFRPAAMSPCELTTEVVREGPRLCLVDAVLTQDGVPVARASTLFLKATGSTAGAVWAPDEQLDPPPVEVAPVSDEPHVPFFRSAGDWSQDFGEHQNAARKMSWNTAVPVLAGEPATPFQSAASAADGASLVANWGDRGVEHINTDITLTLARVPDGLSVGLAGLDRVESGGIAVGTAAVFDRSGRLGTVVVSAIANAKRVVDLGAVEYTDDGRRVRG